MTESLIFIGLNVCRLLILLIPIWIAGILAIVIFRSPLLYKTWKEPYLDVPVVVIESDDWGPGPSSHAKSLLSLVNVLENHHDSVNRPAVLTVNMILTIPDTTVIRETAFREYARISINQSSLEIMNVLKDSISRDLIVPQLHAIEHFNKDVLMNLARNGNKEICTALTRDGWSSWEALEPRLQRHYLDGNGLSSEEILAEHNEVVGKAAILFRDLFNHDTLSTIAPCSFWTDKTEKAWSSHGIRYIQTEGYRLIGSCNKERVYKDPKIIRFGSKNRYGQTYLVRNVMYEPVHGKNEEVCWEETVRSFRQALPAVISTHRYNYIDNEMLSRRSLNGLDDLLKRIDGNYPSRRYLASPELGECLSAGTINNPFSENGKSTWPGISFNSFPVKIEGFIFRLWYRHRKIRLIAMFTGSILPMIVVIGAIRLFRKL